MDKGPKKKGDVKNMKPDPNLKQEQKQPEGMWVSNEAWGKIVSDLSVFKPIVIEAVVKSFQLHGEVR